MEKEIRETGKKGRAVKRGASLSSKKEVMRGWWKKREETRTRRAARHANIGFSRTFGPSARETFIRRFISVMRTNVGGPELSGGRQSYIKQKKKKEKRKKGRKEGEKKVERAANNFFRWFSRGKTSRKLGRTRDARVIETRRGSSVFPRLFITSYDVDIFM